MDETQVVVIPGTVRLSSIAIVHESPNCRVYCVDCHTKRPAVNAYEDGSIFLGVDEYTLRPDPNATTDTEIRFTLDGDGWTIFAEAGRYTVMVCVMKIDAKREVWVDDIRS